MGQRVKYIDLLKGLSIILVVWYHTTHPGFLDYGFRMPLFFFASAIFFKPYPLKTFIEKKIYQLFIPFVFFYLIYYIFLILTNTISVHSFSQFNYGCVFDVFRSYKGTGTPIVNPPLWFIMALFDLQLIMYVLVKLIKSRIVILFLAIVISIIGVVYGREWNTYFQFGRSLQYFVYFALGFLFGKELIKFVDEKGKGYNIILTASTILFFVCLLSKIIFRPGENLVIAIDYFQILSLIILLIYIFERFKSSILLVPLNFYGANSYLVLGLNEIILTSLCIIFLHVFGEINVWLGLIHWVLTMICLIPVINFMNVRLPYLVGKKNIFDKIDMGGKK